MYLRSSLCTVSFLALGTAAFAAPATPEGAARLTSSFQTYFTTTPGVVTVTPQGETYALKLDFAPLAAQIPADKAKVEVSALTYELTDNGDGTWGVTEDQSLNATIDIPGVSRTSYTFGKLTSEGVWDEKLGAFSSQKAEVTDMATDQVSYGPDGKEVSRSSDRTASIKTEVTGKPGADGGVDALIKYEMTGGTTALQMTVDPNQPPMQFTAAYESAHSEGTVTGLETHELYALLGWGVAHPSEAAVTGAQEELRGLLGAALPLFNALDADFTVSKLVVDTPVGTFGADQAVGVVGMNGITEDGRFREAVTLKGLSVPSGLIPPWATGLVPEEIGLDFTVTGYDLVHPAQTLLGAFDLTKPEPVPPELQGQLVGELLPKGSVDITLAPGSATSPVYSLTYEGQMTAGPGTMPTGTARITAKGLDKVQEQLASAPPEISGQVLMPLAMATGLAKKEGDTLVWEIDASQPGSLKINGNDLMGGAQ